MLGRYSAGLGMQQGSDDNRTSGTVWSRLVSAVQKPYEKKADSPTVPAGYLISQASWEGMTKTQRIQVMQQQDLVSKIGPKTDMNLDEGHQLVSATPAVPTSGAPFPIALVIGGVGLLAVLAYFIMKKK